MRENSQEPKETQEKQDLTPEDMTDNIEELKIGKIRIWLPKDDIKEAWNKTKRIIDIYLEEEN